MSDDSFTGDHPPEQTDKQPNKRTNKSMDINDPKSTSTNMINGCDASGPGSLRKSAGIEDSGDLARGESVSVPNDFSDDNSEIEFAKPADHVAVFGDEPEKGEKREAVLIQIAVPKADVYFRTHPSDDFCNVFTMLRYEGEFFFLARRIVPELPNDIRNRVADFALMTAITYDGDDVFLIPLPIDYDRTLGDWASSLNKAAREARDRYLKIVWNKRMRKRDISPLPDDEIVPPGKPKWPSFTYQQLIAKAAEGRTIKSLDDPILRRVRGLPPKS